MKTTISALAGSLLLAGAVSANELIVTSEKNAGGQATALDFSSKGQASALQIRFAVPNGASVSLSKCVSELPATHAGECRYDKGVLTVLVYSDTNAKLPAGVVSIGTVSIAAKAGGSLAMTELLAFDAQANKLSVKSQGDKGAQNSLAK